MTIFLINFIEFFNNQQNLQIIYGMQPELFVGLFPSSTLSLLSLTSGGKKI